ncbi:MAG: polysaccharide deacetylase family protein [Clostridia bacterium]|nr:polysaccharide deacetylase family protein [Clostridia bacterium]
MRRFLIQKAISFIFVIMLIMLQMKTSNEIPASAPVSETKLAVLMYHGFTDGGKESEYVIDVREFEKDIVWLKENGYEFVSVSDLIGHFETGKKLPEKGVMITFDDGYLNNYLYAFPIIKKYAVKVLISPIAYWSDYQTKNPDPNPAYANMTWSQIKEMTDSRLVEIGNHSYNMHSLSDGRMGSDKADGENSEEYRRVFFEDMKNAHLAIKNATGISPVAYAYPFGSISEESVSVLKCFGYRVTFSCREGINTISSDPSCLFHLKRFNRNNNVSAFDILGSVDN